MIELKFSSIDPDEISLAQRYWAMDKSGKFREDVVDLLPFRDVTTVARLVILIRSIAQARDNNQVCPHCGALEEVRSRSRVKKNCSVYASSLQCLSGS